MVISEITGSETDAASVADVLEAATVDWVSEAASGDWVSETASGDWVSEAAAVEWNSEADAALVVAISSVVAAASVASPFPLQSGDWSQVEKSTELNVRLNPSSTPYWRRFFYIEHM